MGFVWIISPRVVDIKPSCDWIFNLEEEVSFFFSLWEKGYKFLWSSDDNFMSRVLVEKCCFNNFWYVNLVVVCFHLNQVTWNSSYCILSFTNHSGQFAEKFPCTDLLNSFFLSFSILDPKDLWNGKCFLSLVWPAELTISILDKWKQRILQFSLSNSSCICKLVLTCSRTLAGNGLCFFKWF